MFNIPKIVLDLWSILNLNFESQFSKNSAFLASPPRLKIFQGSSHSNECIIEYELHRVRVRVSKSKSNLFAIITQNEIKLEQRLQCIYEKLQHAVID